jgi:hypothetical protein
MEHFVTEKTKLELELELELFKAIYTAAAGRKC